jgi:hypothetical protein
LRESIAQRVEQTVRFLKARTQLRDLPKWFAVSDVALASTHQACLRGSGNFLQLSDLVPENLGE